MAIYYQKRHSARSLLDC